MQVCVSGGLLKCFLYSQVSFRATVLSRPVGIMCAPTVTFVCCPSSPYSLVGILWRNPVISQKSNWSTLITVVVSLTRRR